MIIAKRVLHRYLRADLSPSLGKPGGPCQVVRRIDKEVQGPALKDQLIDKVEEGKSLSNPEAGKVYDVEHEKARGLVTKFTVGPHTQYRMDLRSVSVKDLQKAFAEWSKEMHSLRKKEDPRYQETLDALNRGGDIRYTSPDRLTVVFAGREKGTVKVITTWWQGTPDPPPPGSCVI